MKKKKKKKTAVYTAAGVKYFKDFRSAAAYMLKLKAARI